MTNTHGNRNRLTIIASLTNVKSQRPIYTTVGRREFDKALVSPFVGFLLLYSIFCGLSRFL